GRIDADDAMMGQFALENLKGFVVVWVAISREEHDAVGEIKIGVAGGKTLAAVFDDTGHRKLDDAKRAILFVSQGTQSFQILLQDLVIIIGGIFFDNRHDGRRVDEATEIVDVAVGVVADNSFSKPKDV